MTFESVKKKPFYFYAVFIYMSILLGCLLFFLCGAEGQTQDLAHGKRELPPSLFLCMVKSLDLKK